MAPANVSVPEPDLAKVAPELVSAEPQVMLWLLVLIL